MPPVSEAVRRTRAPAYVVAALVLIIPLMEIGSSAWPYRIHDPSWRIGLIAVAAGASSAILLGLLLIYVLSAVFEDRPAIWFVALIGALMSAMCVLAAGAFTLDVLQIKGQVRPGMETRYNMTSALGLAKLCFAGFAALVLAVSAFRSGRNLYRTSLRGTKKASPVIVTSSSPAVPGGPVA